MPSVLTHSQHTAPLPRTLLPVMFCDEIGRVPSPTLYYTHQHTRMTPFTSAPLLLLLLLLLHLLRTATVFFLLFRLLCCVQAVRGRQGPSANGATCRAMRVERIRSCEHGSSALLTSLEWRGAFALLDATPTNLFRLAVLLLRLVCCQRDNPISLTRKGLAMGKRLETRQ